MHSLMCTSVGMSLLVLVASKVLYDVRHTAWYVQVEEGS